MVGNADEEVYPLHRMDSTQSGDVVLAARNAFALKMAALHDLSVELALADDADELCRRAVVLGHRVLGFDRLHIWFVDPEDPALLYGCFGTDERGQVRDERGISYRRSAEALPPGFYEGKEPVYYMGQSPCFNERHEVVGTAERALALIWDGRRVIGEISVDNLITQRSIDGGSLELLVRFARIVGYLSSLKRAQAELRAQAAAEDLPGIVGRKTCLVLLEKQLYLANRKGESLSVIACGLVGMNAVPRTARLAAAAELLEGILRGGDAVGALGDEELLIALPDCDEAGAALIDARVGESLAQASKGSGGLSMPRGRASSTELEGLGRERSVAALLGLAEERMREALRGVKAG